VVLRGISAHNLKLTCKTCQWHYYICGSKEQPNSTWNCEKMAVFRLISNEEIKLFIYKTNVCMCLHQGNEKEVTKKYEKGGTHLELFPSSGHSHSVCFFDIWLWCPCKFLHFTNSKYWKSFSKLFHIRRRLVFQLNDCLSKAFNTVLIRI